MKFASTQAGQQFYLNFNGNLNKDFTIRSKIYQILWIYPSILTGHHITSVKSDNFESISKEKLSISFISAKDWQNHLNFTNFIVNDMDNEKNSIRRETRIRPYGEEREREKVLLRTKIIDWMRSAKPTVLGKDMIMGSICLENIME